jgi:glycyl-tRNA synthetase (class II)
MHNIKTKSEEMVLGIGDREFDIKSSFFNFKRYEKKVYGKLAKSFFFINRKYKKNLIVEEIIPAIIEPSFGIGRIMYAILEHNFKKRQLVKNEAMNLNSKKYVTFNFLNSSFFDF